MEATSLWALAATLAKAVLLLIGARLLFSLYEGYQVRMRFRKLKAQGIVRFLATSYTTFASH